MPSTKEILVIGGTGAQGMPVVKALSASGRYTVRVLTRDASSQRARTLASLPGVTLLQGAQDNQTDLRRAFHGVHGAWVNTDGFTLGEKDELFYGVRAYELARAAGVRHFVWAGIEYALHNAGWDERYHCGHMDAKGRVAAFVLAQGQEGMRTSVLGTGPYMDMLMDGLFVPREQGDGSFMWESPAPEDTKIPLIALSDVGVYSLWLFDNPSEAAGMDLSIATDEVSFGEIAKALTETSGVRARHRQVTFDEYADTAEPYPGAAVNWSLGPDAPRDESVMAWRDKFRAWWRYWGEGVTPRRDFALLDRIHPGRIKNVGDWMRQVGYDGKPRNMLKMFEDWEERKGGGVQRQAARLESTK